MPQRKGQMRNPYPMCREKRIDCFGYLNGLCLVLNDTDLKRKCPFYKSKEEYDTGETISEDT